MNFNDIFEEIKSSPEKHPRDNKEYKRLEYELLELVQKSGFISGGSSKDNFGPFDPIHLYLFLIVIMLYLQFLCLL